MNAVIYYSNTNESKRIAQYLAKKLGYTLLDVYDVNEYVYGNAVVVFPVYCQNIPNKVKEFLARFKADNFAAVATYGQMGYGNVLYEIQQKYARLTAAAYVPTKHAYLDGERFDRFDRLDVIADKFRCPALITVPKAHKHPFANFIKELRSRIGVKIIRDGSKCDNCGICAKMCNQHAIKNGKTTNKCIRCMKCVVNCPNNALTLRKSKIMAKYLSKPRQTELLIYV